MIKETKEPRRPAAFSADDPDLTIDEELLETDDVTQADLQNALKSKKRFGWFSLFISAIGGLVLLSITLWLASFVTALFFRKDWIGWLSLVLLVIAAVAGLVLLFKEIIGLLKLKRQGRLKLQAEMAIADKNLEQSKQVIKGVEQLLLDRKELRWGFSNLKEQGRDILDADQMLILAEKVVISDLDKQAREIIATSSRRVAIVTTLSPAAVIDMAFVAFENLRLIRRIAILYGGRPGLYSLLRLGRMVLTHLTLAGGLALSADLVQQFLGQRLAAKISAKLGEGLFNGTLTARIGLAAVDICRPLPFIQSKKPTIRELVGSLISGIVKK